MSQNEGNGNVDNAGANDPSHETDQAPINKDPDATNNTDIATLLKSLEGQGNIIIKEVLLQMNKTIGQLEKSNSYLMAENSEIREDLRSTKSRLDLAEGLILTLKKQNGQQAEEILDLKTRSMRDNLIFTGIPEREGENPANTLTKFLENEMRISEAKNIKFDRVHRMGPTGRGNRSIIAKITPSKDKGKILSHGKNLKGKNFRVFEQFPPEIQERRSRLMPIFKEAKGNPAVRNVTWSTDKLIVDGRTHSAKDVPLDIEANNSDSVDIKHGQQKIESGSTFQADSADLQKVDDVNLIMANLLKNKSLATATHNIFAYRVGNQAKPREGLNDDGEHGGARKIMEVMRANNITNKIVIVTRWYGGTHIGKKRFEAIENCTKNILNLET